MRSVQQLKSGLLFAALAVTMTTACKKDDKTPTPGGGGGSKPPIELDCDYFNQPRVLTDDPERAVDYLISCKMAATADIKIEPGVVIEFSQDAGIAVDDFNVPSASLSAIGTSDKPIIFRGKVKQKGYWAGIYFESNSTQNELHYVQVEDAGGDKFNSNNDRGGVIVVSNSKLKMSNSKVTNSKTYGINIRYNENSITLNNNIFTGNKSPGYVSGNNINILNATNTFSGNEDDFLEINAYSAFGTVTTASTWHKIDVPYRMTNFGSMDIKALLTIQPGVHIEFPADFYMYVNEDGGGLKAVGTAADPIIMTGITKAPKAWRGIYIQSEHPANEIAFTEMHYSGIGAPQGNVYLWYNRLLNIHDVKFKNTHGCGINYKIHTGQPSNPNLTIGPNITTDPGGCIGDEWL